MQQAPPYQQQYGAAPDPYAYGQGGGYDQGVGYGAAGGYDPNAGYGQGAWEEPEKTEKQLIKEMKKARAKERGQSSAQCGFWVIILLGFLVSCLWVIPIFGDKWHTKMFAGFGIGKGGWHITTSLLDIDMTMECGGKLGYKTLDKFNPETGLCKMILPIMGKRELAYFKEFMCALPVMVGNNGGCDVATRLYFSSFVPFVTSICAASFNVLGLGMLWYYWMVQPLNDTLWWAKCWLITACLFGFFGFFTFVLVTPDLGEIPQVWAAGMPQGLFTVKEVHDMPFGWCFFMAVAAMFFQLVLAICWITFFRRHVLEKQTEREEEARKDAIEAMYDAHNCRWEEETVPLAQGGAGQYGADGYAAPYGAAPQPYSEPYGAAPYGAPPYGAPAAQQQWG